MSKITINDRRCDTAISVPSVFLTDFMPKANGEYVKVYLYLLHAKATGASVEISALADLLDDTEKDILRALRYWNQEGLIALSLDESNAINGIDLLPILDHSAPISSTPTAVAPTANVPAATPAMVVAKTEVNAEPKAVPLATPNTEVQTELQTKFQTEEASLPEDRLPEFEREQIRNSEEFGIICTGIEQYLGGYGKLSKSIADSILEYVYMFQNYDVVEYLYEHCVEMGKSSHSYIDRVAKQWYQEGIRTRQDAIDANKNYQDAKAMLPLTKEVLKTFGLQSAPAPLQIAYVTRWQKEFGMSDDAILLACTRTIAKKHEPNFQYTEGILSKWKEAGVFCAKDVAAYDQAHQEEVQAAQNARVAAAMNATTTTARVAKKTAFHNFQQRDNTEDDLDALFFKRTATPAKK